MSGLGTQPSTEIKESAPNTARPASGPGPAPPTCDAQNFDGTGGREKSRKWRQVAGLLSPAQKKLNQAFSGRDRTLDHFMVTAEFALRNQHRQTGEEPQGAPPSPRRGPYSLFGPKNVVFGPETRRPSTFYHFRDLPRVSLREQDSGGQVPAS